MMLNSYPTQINGEVIPFPDTWAEKPQKIINQFKTEAGGLKHIVVRSSRLAVDASFTVTNRWLKKFLQYRNENTLTVAIYDAITNATAQHTMFIVGDSFSYELVHDSRYMNNTNGLYKLSFTIEEF